MNPLEELRLFMRVFDGSSFYLCRNGKVITLRIATGRVAKERKVCMPTTCGQGLAERSTLPAKLSALSAAMADNLEKHQRTLDFTDHNARAENDAYDAVARALRNAATELQAIADRMASYSALPMPRHDQRAATSADIRDAFALFVEREVDLSVLLSSLIQQDREMLAQWDRMAAT